MAHAPKENYLLLASRRDTIISDTLSEYSSAVDGPMNDIDFAERRTADAEKAEHLKENIMISLKLND